MELRHLRYFVAVADAENVSRAALGLRVSQPAVSRQVRDLEEELGFPLLVRGARSVRLTDAGRSFLDGARSVLQRVDEAVAVARTVATDGRTTLDVGYATSPTARILPAALRAFQSLQTGVRVRLHDLSTEGMLAGLRDETLQIAFLVCSSGSLLRGLRSTELARLAICVAAAPGHPLARRRRVSLAEIARHPLIAFSRKDYPDYHELLDALFTGSALRPRVAEEHDSVSSLITALEAGSGVAVVTDSLACVAGPRLRLLPISPAPPPFVIAAAWPRSGLGAPAAQFLECVRKAAAPEGPAVIVRRRNG